MNFDPSSSVRFKGEAFKPELSVVSPGRINLIGEHTDYNMGFVLPAAIDRSICFEIAKNGSESDCYVYSSDYDKILSFKLDQVEPSPIEWENYILGVVHEIQKLGRQLKGFDCRLKSNLPVGSGISSSAALECGSAFALNELFQLGLTKLEIIKAGQKAEHNFVGTQCGIMDQFASVMSEPGQAILLDCQDVSHQFIPLHLESYTLLLLNTNVTHSLASSGYNDRKSDCETGVEILQGAGLKIESLREVSLEQLEAHRDLLSPTVFKRCCYVVQENDRVLKAAKALSENRLEDFGKLLYASHQGQQHEYEVSCTELDFLVDFSRDYPEILGSRMMGGGFGGCTINLIHQDFVENYIDVVVPAYEKAFNRALTPIHVRPSGGTYIK